MVSLKDQLEGLVDPAPKEIDPENDVQGSDSEVEKADDSLKRAHYVEVGKSRLRDTVLEGEKYKGKKTDRKSLYGYESSDQQDSEGEEQDSDDGDELDSEDEDSEDSGEVGAEDDRELGSEDDSELGSEAESESESQQDQESEDEDAKRQELKRLMAAEQQKIVTHLSSAAKADAEKGAAVKSQMSIYEGALDLRINMQKALAASNVLPVDSAGLESLDQEQDEDEEEEEDLKQEALESLYELMENISNLRVELMINDGILEKKPKLSRKRTLGQAFGNVALLDESINKYRETTLDKWSRKIQSSSGATALQNSRFKSLNQTAAVQVATVLADMERLVKRTQINRSNYKVLGMTSQNNEPAQVDAQEEPYIFDDTDFYRLQLKELVDKRMADSSSAALNNGIKWAVSKSKNKKNVDTKASKGRKLRYTVQEKIQGFAAPQPHALPWNDDQRDDLFSSLFGQGIKLDDSEPEEGGEGDDDDEGQFGDEPVDAVVEDGVKLFG